MESFYYLVIGVGCLYVGWVWGVCSVGCDPKCEGMEDPTIIILKARHDLLKQLNKKFPDDYSIPNMN